jgi:hypothetical protein
MTARFKAAIQIRLRQLPGTGCNGAEEIPSSQTDSTDKEHPSRNCLNRFSNIGNPSEASCRFSHPFVSLESG